MSNPKAYSSHTPKKQETLVLFLNTLYEQYKQSEERFTYVDLTAGPGTWYLDEDQERTNPIKGSPVIAREIFKDGFDGSILFEKNKKHRQTLLDTLDDEGDYIVYKDYMDAAEIFRTQDFTKSKGLVYYDPCGAPNLKMLLDVHNALPSKDILLHFSPTCGKRIRGRTDINQNPGKTVQLSEFLMEVKKDRAYISYVGGSAFNWTFLLLSDRELDLSRDGVLNQNGIVDLFSKEGFDRFKKINFTIEENDDIFWGRKSVKDFVPELYAKVNE